MSTVSEIKFHTFKLQRNVIAVGNEKVDVLRSNIFEWHFKYEISLGILWDVYFAFIALAELMHNAKLYHCFIQSM